MFYDAPLAVHFDSSVGFYRQMTVLDIELLELAAVKCDGHYSGIRDSIARFDAKFLELWGILSQNLKSFICDVTFSDIQ